MDGNGVVSFTEFLTTMSISAKGSVDDKLNWSFNLYDTNGDGTISRKEAVDIIWVQTQLINNKCYLLINRGMKS